MLNSLAQAGTTTGNFMYVDTSVQGYQEEIIKSMTNSLNMAMSSASAAKINILLNGDKIDQKICDVDYQTTITTDLGEIPMEIDGDDMIEDENWDNALYRVSLNLPEKVLKNKNLKVELLLTSDVTVTGKISILEITDVPDDMKFRAEIENLNQKTFKLIQKIQDKSKSKKEKTDAYDELKSYDGYVDRMHETCLRIKDRDLKKELFGKLLEAKTMQGNIYKHLRNETNLDNLSNHCIAGLNNLAFKAIQSNRLNKLVDKRAIQNE